MHVNPVYSVPWWWLCTYIKSCIHEIDKCRVRFKSEVSFYSFIGLDKVLVFATPMYIVDCFPPPPLPLYIVNLSPSQKSLDPSRIPDLVTKLLVELNCMQFCSLYNCQFVDMDQFQFSNRFRFKVLNLHNVTPSVTNETTYIIPYSNDINQFYIRMYHSLV